MTVFPPCFPTGGRRGRRQRRRGQYRGTGGLLAPDPAVGGEADRREIRDALPAEQSPGEEELHHRADTAWHVGGERDERWAARDTAGWGAAAAVLGS